MKPNNHVIRRNSRATRNKYLLVQVKVERDANEYTNI